MTGGSSGAVLDINAYDEYGIAHEGEAKRGCKIPDKRGSKSAALSQGADQRTEQIWNNIL